MDTITSDTLELLLGEALERKFKGLDHELVKLLELKVIDSSGGTKIDPEEVMRARLPEIAAIQLQKQITAAKTTLVAVG